MRCAVRIVRTPPPPLDIVWLQEESITLADGSTAKALVPHVYATVRSNDLSADGKLLANASSSLISGNSVTANTTGDINNSGSILGRALVNLSSKSGNINITTGAQTAADTVALQAGKDINITGAQVVANNNLTAQAGRDINITSTAQSSTGSAAAYSFSQSGVDRMAGLYTRGPGILIASAANNVNLTAAQISTGGDALIAAGNTINLGTIVQSRSDNFHANNADNHFLSKSSSEVGSSITSTGNTTLQAGKDINARAATIQASGDLSASATNINITAGQSSGGFLSSSTTTIKNTASSTTAQASELGGTNISLTANKDTSGTGGNITVTGSNVLADQDITLKAANNVTIEAATNTASSTSFYEKTSSGLSFSGPSVSWGNTKQNTDQKGNQSTASASTVGSIGGNVSITAGNTYTQSGSDIQAAGIDTTTGRANTRGLTDGTVGNVNITAKDVNITAAKESARSSYETHYEQSGITVGVGNAIISAAQSANSVVQAAGQLSGKNAGRMAALAAAAVGLNAYNTVGSMTNEAGNFDAGKATALNINVSIGSSSSESKSTSESTNTRGSNIASAGNTTIQAVKDSANTGGNLTVEGSSVKADNTVTLNAQNQLNLIASQNTNSERSSSSSSSSSVGASYGAGGWGFSVSGNSSRGSGNGDGVSYTNSQVQGRSVSLTSGQDTGITGAVVKGEQVTANVGGNLSIASPQDKNTYSESSSSSGGSIGFGAGGITGGSISAGATNINSNYQSVNQTSGIKTGDGGFNVNVGGNTSLTGGVIASTDKAVEQNKNSFTTGGTLSINNVQNSADYKADGYQVNAGVGSQKGGSAGIGQDDGSASSTTTAGISGIAGNQSVRSSDADTRITPIFDKDAVKSDISAQITITAEFGKQASKTVGDYAGKQLEKAIADAAKETDPDKKAALDQEIKDWSEGGAKRVALHTVVGALTGGVDGAIGAATSQTAIPVLAESIKKLDVPEAVKDALVEAASIGIGLSTGGTVGAATAQNATANNYLFHKEAVTRALLQDKLAKGILTAAEQQQLTDLEVLDNARDLALKDLCKKQGDACDLAHRDLNAAIASYATTAASYNAKLSPDGNKSVTEKRDAAIALDNNPEIASQTRWDSFKEFASPQIAGYLTGAALNAYIAEARALYVAIKAETNAASAAAAAEAAAIAKARVENNASRDGGVDPYAEVPNAAAQNNVRNKVAADAASGTRNPHYDAKHGPTTTLQAQYDRAMYGTNPQTGGSGSPVDASKFFNATDMETAITKAEAQYAADPSKFTNGNVPITFTRPVGEGYVGASSANINNGLPVGQYRWSNTVTVGIDSATGKAYTAYPNMRLGTPMPDPLRNGVQR